MKDGRRLCGVPVWLFIVLVLLTLVVVTAAVVVPLQIVNGTKNALPQTALERCERNTPCQNGGQNVATESFCGCICTGSWTGSNCTEQAVPDLGCASINLSDSTAGQVGGMKTATLGSALPRLLAKAKTYNIVLDANVLLGVFTHAKLSCSLQNALVNFDGQTAPAARRRRRLARRQQAATNPATIDTDTLTASVPSAPPPTDAPAPHAPVSQDVVDFGRVAVLYVAQLGSIERAAAAQQALNDTFEAGVGSGRVQTGDVAVLLDERSIRLAGGQVVGGGGFAGATSTAGALPAATEAAASTRRA